MKRIEILIATSLSAILMACGGGGGSSDVSSPDALQEASIPPSGAGNPAAGAPANGGTSEHPPASDRPSSGARPDTPVPPSSPSPGSSAPFDLSRALAARFAQPSAIASDAASGALYVADYGTVRRIAPDGEVATVAGMPGEFGSPATGGNDGVGAEARFNAVSAITVGADGNLYVADTVTNTGSIRRISPDGVVTTLLREVYALGVTADGQGNLYVSDNGTGNVRRIAADGSVSTVAQDLEPRGITVDNAGNLYVTDTGFVYPALGKTRFSCTIDKIPPTGEKLILAGMQATQPIENTCGAVDGPGTDARIGSGAQGIAVDAAGTVYFTDTLNHTIRKVSPDGYVTTLAGVSGQAGSADGTAAAARFHTPKGITIGRDGNLYVADTGNYTIRRVTPDGVVTTVAGKAGERGSADTPGTALPTPSPSPAPVPAPGSGDPYPIPPAYVGVNMERGVVYRTDTACRAYVIETLRGFVVADWMGGGLPNAGDVLVGELNRLGTRNVFDATSGAESRMFISNTLLARDAALADARCQ